MQYFSFKDLLVSLLFFLATCHQAEPTVVTSNDSSSVLQLPEPKDDDEKKYRDVLTKVTVILLDNEKIYAYEGKEIDKGSYHRYDEVGDLVKKSKEKFSAKEFVVVIKTASKATYTKTVDVLDEMNINNIQRYTINNLSPEEKKKLNLE